MRYKLAFVIGASLFVLTLLGGRLSATEQEAEESTGLPVGQSAPPFTLRDQRGKEVSLASLVNKGPVAVVFHRSASWCVYCKLQMVQLQRIEKEIQAAGGQVVGISYDSV